MDEYCAAMFSKRQKIADRLEQLGIVLPPPMPPAGNYIPCFVDDDVVYVGGHGPVDGDVIIRGKVGGDLTLEQGREAARNVRRSPCWRRSTPSSGRSTSSTRS